MNTFLKICLFLALGIWGTATAEEPAKSQVVSSPNASPSMEQIASVSPALAAYTEDLLLQEVWNRKGLSKRDRSIVTVAALIAQNHVTDMPFYINLAFDNGVTPTEISETITHLAFYAGWGNAMSAVVVTSGIFKARGVKPEQLPSKTPTLLPLDKDAEAKRQRFVEETYAEVSPGVVHYTTEALFLDLWLRPGLAPRDRSLITVSALIASGKVEQISFHLSKAMDNGLTKPQVSEVLTHLAFYAGWPNVFSALPVAKEVWTQRSPG
ncbi:carboxymuconolactone decarboxylase family protein [Allohahella sp. A8]|uniref:carboxymuconolactone decarboxylase family protein n=1 Tax=Allohahella sp. A8 TaxID=3141461 RepID=UPI003A800DCA